MTWEAEDPDTPVPYRLTEAGQAAADRFTLAQEITLPNVVLNRMTLHADCHQPEAEA
jgi:hypothetical protein